MNYSESPRDEDGVATDRSAGVAGAPPPRQRRARTTPARRQRRLLVLRARRRRGRLPALRRRQAGARGMDLQVQMHYTPTGKEVVDRPLFGFTVSEEPPARQWLATQISARERPSRFRRTTRTGWRRPPESSSPPDVELVQMMPHMHLRGKDMTYKVIFPDGREQIVLNVPNNDFNWQIALSGGHADQDPEGNAAEGRGALQQLVMSNKFNPDPNRTVYPGRMTWEEMFNPFFGVIVDKGTDPTRVLKLGQFLVSGGGA